MGLPDGSVGKESSCNARDTGDPNSIPQLGISPGGGNSYPLQYSPKNPIGQRSLAGYGPKGPKDD